MPTLNSPFTSGSSGIIRDGFDATSDQSELEGDAVVAMLDRLSVRIILLGVGLDGEGVAR